MAGPMSQATQQKARGEDGTATAIREESARDPVRDAQERAREIRARGLFSANPFNKYHVPADIVPLGWTYEWKRWMVYGMDDRENQVLLSQEGWTRVPQERHPDFLVQRGGDVLMERPAEITDEFRNMHRRRSDVSVGVVSNHLAQVVGKHEQPGGGPKLQSGVTKTYEKIPD